MAGPRIDHIHVTVRDIERAERFYDALLPLLGFDLALKERAVVRDRDYRLVEYHHAAFSLGIVSERPQYSFDPVSRRRAGAVQRRWVFLPAPPPQTTEQNERSRELATHSL